MTAAQRTTIEIALAGYGASLDANEHIVKTKTLNVSITITSKRLRFLSGDGALLASYPVKDLAAGVADFVEKFWYWRKS